MDERQFNFTEARMRALAPATDGKDYYRYDAEVSGLGIRVSGKGTKTFIWYRSVNGRPERVKIGRFPDVTVIKARERAAEWNAERADGKSIKEQRQTIQDELNLEELFAAYIEQYAKDRCTTWKDMDKNFRRWFKEWMGKRLSSISKVDVQTKINRLGTDSGPHAANKAHDDLRAVFSWGNKRNLFIGENPCVGIDKFRVQSRDRFVQPGEWMKFLEAVLKEPNDKIKDCTLLCLSTGQRKSNVMAMRWEEINWELRTWLIPRTKNGESLTVSLTTWALNVLRGRHKEAGEPKKGWVLPGDGVTGHLVEPKLGWRRILKEAGLENLRIHDLRRTMGSYMAIGNTNSPLIQKALGHKSLQAAARYQRVHMDPVELAMNNAVDLMLHHAGVLEEQDNVVELKKA